MRSYPIELSAAERRVALLIEGRRSERIIKLFWLARQREAVRGFLAELSREVRELRRELAEDHGFDQGDLQEVERPQRRAAAGK